MSKTLIDIEVKSYFDRENNYWVVASKECNIIGYGKNIIEAKKKFKDEVKKILHPDKQNDSKKINQLCNNVREIRGQLLSYGFKKNSVLISSIDVIINNSNQF